MKKIITMAFVLLGTLSLAEDIGSNVDLKISNIEKASTPQERVRLVNEFKMTLANMSANERASAINQLRASMKGETTPQNGLLQRQAQVHQMQDMQNNLSQQVIQQQNALPQSISEGMTHIGISNPISSSLLGSDTTHFTIQK